MKNLIVKYSKQQLTDWDIINIEKELRINLPIEYKEFLLKYNGGNPEQDHFDFLYREGGSVIHRFFAHFDGDNSINLLKEYVRFEDRIPKGFIPIARDCVSNRICLDVRDTRSSKVYFWEIDYAVPLGEEPTFDNMHLLANNFTDFINGLYKIIELKKDVSGEDIFVYAHDKYSLPFSTETKKYGALVTEFFAQAPQVVEDYIIEEPDSSPYRLLWYEVKAEGKKYFRKINADGSFKDYEEILNGV